MKTEIINYKDVFQLVIIKGYHIDKLKVDLDKESEERRQRFLYMEMCLIRKWLRDTHKIIVLVRPYNFGKSYFTSVLATEIDRDFTTEERKTYEDALLTGIYEALQLI